MFYFFLCMFQQLYIYSLSHSRTFSPARTTSMQYLYRTLIETPMRYFYLNGHWRGLDESSICASLTNFDADFWRQQSLACAQVIERQVHSLNVTAITLVYFLSLSYVTIFGLSSAIAASTRLFLHRLNKTTTTPSPHDCSAEKYVD